MILHPKMVSLTDNDDESTSSYNSQFSSNLQNQSNKQTLPQNKNIE